MHPESELLLWRQRERELEVRLARELVREERLPVARSAGPNGFGLLRQRAADVAHRLRGATRRQVEVVASCCTPACCPV